MFVCACASAEVPEPADGGCTLGPQCETSDPDKNKQQYDASVSLPGVSDASATERDPLCGDDTDSCDPDDPAACPRSAESGGDGPAAEGGADPGSPGLDVGVALSCQVQAGPDGQRAVCASAGTGTSGSPCVSGADCAPGFACVEAAGTAQCRRYCCNDRESCDTGTYCAKRTLRLDANAALAPVTVPVCVTAVACPLLEPYPCPEDTTCFCPDKTACTVVRADGTTDCLPPGTGVEGDKCPCAAGHVCSQGTNTCLKICKLTVAEPQCTEGLCQRSKSLPDGYGLCVGDTADAG
ncbi:MAG: hypothetical protein JW940_36195 [Polyangiaceae bacterium]|nr:hypothetical protein [Polyangiaceae bacterium]